jgi:ATP-dependent DNA helicase DinG
VSLEVSKILGPGGLIARRLKQYEHRPQQLEMAEAVWEALSTKRHLIAEAGTGVGKSFAYLVPAILHATANQIEEHGRPLDQEEQDAADQDDNIRRIVVSTHTISLQEQLINKDLPLLNSVIPREFSSVLVKGRSNYLSRQNSCCSIARRKRFLSTSTIERLGQDDQRRLAQLVTFSS